jgi:predicted nucleotide-binding protein
MTKKKSSLNVTKVTTELVKEKDIFNSQLDQRVKIGQELYDRKINTQEEFSKIKEEYSEWDDWNSEYLKQAFNIEQNEYRSDYDNSEPIIFRMMKRQTPTQDLMDFKEKVKRKTAVLKKLRKKSDLLKVNITLVAPEKLESVEVDKSKVFIVHGHDEEIKTKAARFVEKLGFEAIILHEQASSSKSIIEKIERYSDVGFAIILYTPCDLGSKNKENEKLKTRARQNVVFEHGFFIGKIGRENVCALVKEDTETPNDISGVVYISIDEAGGWMLSVAKEMKESGFEIDMNNL